MCTSDGKPTIRRGASFDISFWTETLIPRRSTPSSSALIPMVVGMHVASAVATRSVGENASPLPLLSVGASVEIFDCDGPCVASQCKSPVYLTETLTISFATDYHRFSQIQKWQICVSSVAIGVEWISRYILQPDPEADSKYLRYEKESDGKRFKEGSAAQSSYS